MEYMKIEANDISNLELVILEMGQTSPDLKLKYDSSEDTIDSCPGTCHYSCMGTAKK